MPSPFPGMDPWLESPAVFPDIHDALIFLLREALNTVLPSGYFATGAARIWMDEKHHREPDVSVTRPPDWEPTSSGGVAAADFERAGMLAVEAPYLAEPIEEKYLEIRSTANEHLVTAIEVVSPTNKQAGEAGRGSYRQKQAELRSRGVNLVEIDLLRGGTHVSAIPLNQLRPRAGSYDYHVCVTAHDAPGMYFIAPFRLTDQMPAVAVPLENGTPPVSIELQPLFDRSYDTGRYGERLPYAGRKPDPPLTDDQRAWAEGILRAKGLVK